MSDLIFSVNEFNFEKDGAYLDVTVHEEAGSIWLELKIDVSDSFSIQSVEDLDFMYEKMRSALIKRTV